MLFAKAAGLLAPALLLKSSSKKMAEKILFSPVYQDGYRTRRTFYTDEQGFGSLEVYTPPKLPDVRIVFVDAEVPPVILARGTDDLSFVMEDEELASQIVAAAKIVASIKKEE